MIKGATRRIKRGEKSSDAQAFLDNHKACLVVVSGGPAGVEFSLDRAEVVMGRGPDVDLIFKDDAMSRSHAALEVTQDGFRIRDLGSTNGVKVNGAPIEAAALKHGDRIELGEHVLQYILEKRSAKARTYLLPES